MKEQSDGWKSAIYVQFVPTAIIESNMATEGLRVENQSETLDSLQREAENLKKKLEEEKDKLKDIDSEFLSNNIL